LLILARGAEKVRYYPGRRTLSVLKGICYPVSQGGEEIEQEGTNTKRRVRGGSPPQTDRAKPRN